MPRPKSPEQRHSVTAGDVAREAGVSISAVSRSYTPGASVSPKTREKVLRAAQQLGYQPNLLARSLMTRRTDLIGILVADFSNPLYLSILDLFTHTIQQRGLHSLLFNVAHEDDLSEAIQMVMRYQLDGLVVTSATLSPLLAEQCAQKQVPVVVFGRYSRRSPTSAVCCDNVAGGAMAADLLIDRGYRRPAFIGGPAGVSTTVDRRRGFVERLHQRGSALRAEESGGAYTYAAGYDAMRRMLHLPEPPDSIFCANDIIALGAMDVARYRFGIDIPDDLGVIGFDDIMLADSESYKLTTIRQPFQKMIDMTMNLLQEQFKKPALKPKLRFLAGELIERDSTRGPAAGYSSEGRQ